jgi:hypothetical protein
MPSTFHKARSLVVAWTLVYLFASCATQPRQSVFEVSTEILSDLPLSQDRYAREDINGPLPDRITLKTRMQSFNSYHSYALRDGRIWYKGLSRATGPTEWSLFMKTGLPHNEKQTDFHTPRKIVELSADGDELFALSDEGWLYRIVFDKGYSRKRNYWYDLLGWPTAAPLQMDGAVATNRGWAIGKRNRAVRYYEDIFGNQHHYGTIGILTNYVLMADGQEIRFADVGLPSDFSRTLLGPERGAFIAENISASASTIFLIGAAGEMYTRLADFDTIGCDPMFFKYTYEPYVSKFQGKDYRSNYEPWGLPGEDWRVQPRIPLTGRAAISRRITIMQNGRGNAARELRVAGKDADGQIGYWSKSIFGDTWSFVRSPLHISKEDYLHPEAFADGKGPRGPIADVNLRGSLLKDGQVVSDWTFEIPDFNILEGSCTLVIKRGKERASIIFYPVEAWTYHKREEPGRDGTPKAFLGTFEIPPDAFAGLSNEFRAELERSIVADDRKLFSYIVEAATDYMLIEPRDRSKRGYALFFTASGDPNLHPDSFRIGKVAALAKFNRSGSEELAMPSGGPFVQADLPGLRSRISANETLAADIATRAKIFTSSRRKAEVSRFTYSAFSLVTHATLLYRIDFPKVYTLTRHGGALLELNNDQVDLVAGTRIWLDGLLLDLIENRIDAYSTAVRALENGAALAYLPVGFCESYCRYMDGVGLPSRMKGRFVPDRGVERFPETAKDGTLPACIRAVPFNDDFPGWLMDVGEEPAFTLLVELESAAKKMYARNGLSAVAKPLTLRARLHLVSTGSEERDRDLYRRTIGNAAFSEGGVPASVRWDGSTLTIKRVAESSTELLFRGVLPTVQE